MKTKHGLLFGFAVIAIAAMFTLAGCPTEDDGGDGNGNGNGNGGGPTIADFEGEWVYYLYSSNTLTVTKAEGDTFTLVYTNAGGTYTYTLSYTGAIADVALDSGSVMGKGVPFTGVGKRSSGNGSVSEGNDNGGLFRATQTIATTTGATSDTATPAGYLIIQDPGTAYVQLLVFYEDENAASGLNIGGKKHFVDLKFERPE